MDARLIVSSPPYLRNGETAHCLMFDVFIASLPIIAVSIFFFGWYVLWIIVLSMATAKITEMLVQIFFRAEHFNFRSFFYSVLTDEDITIMDGSAAVTGLLLAFTLPPTVPFWIPVTGSAFAIVVGKHVFGGLGYNIFNPALAGRAFLLAAWPGAMTAWCSPLPRGSAAPSAVDAVSGATPLVAMKLHAQATPILDLITGNISGCIGETSAAAILLGAAYMLYKGTITWHVPCSYIGTVFLLALVLGQNPVFHLFAGGLMLGAFFMATDVVTSPVTRSGRLIFGCGAGILTLLIRRYGGYPEGVCYSILIMNALTPLIEKCTARKFHKGEISVTTVERLLKK